MSTLYSNVGYIRLELSVRLLYMELNCLLKCSNIAVVCQGIPDNYYHRIVCIDEIYVSQVDKIRSCESNRVWGL